MDTECAICAETIDGVNRLQGEWEIAVWSWFPFNILQLLGHAIILECVVYVIFDYDHLFKAFLVRYGLIWFFFFSHDFLFQ
jgi:hypothetical protein